MSFFQIKDVTKSFGGLQAVAGVSFSLERGELVGLIGPNGSGKTTLLNLLSGYYPPGSGSILIEEEPVQGLPPNSVFHRGIVRMFQQTRVFSRISVADNLLVSGYAAGLDVHESSGRAKVIMEKLELLRLADEDAGHLSGGQQKLLEFGCCFIGDPKLVLLDEPFAAIHPSMKEIIARYIVERHAQGQTFIIVSHDIPAVLELCPRSVVMNAGMVIADDPTDQVLQDENVIEAYLGEKYL
ncbi:MAG: ATP-binding cassette domain-containing protein [Desulfoferrobacter sp.]